MQGKKGEEFWNGLIERGGWWDPSYPFGEWRKKFNTPSGRFEFYSLSMDRRLKEISKGDPKRLDQILVEMKIEARGDKIFLPHFEKPRWVGEEKISFSSDPLQIDDNRRGQGSEPTLSSGDLRSPSEGEMEFLGRIESRDG